MWVEHDEVDKAVDVIGELQQPLSIRSTACRKHGKVVTCAK